MYGLKYINWIFPLLQMCITHMEGVNMMEDGDSDSIEDDMQSFLIDSSDESNSE